MWGESELLVPHSHPSALSPARHLCCLGSQAVEITSEGQVVLFFSQKIRKRENPCPLDTLGVAVKECSVPGTPVCPAGLSVSPVGTAAAQHWGFRVHD